MGQLKQLPDVLAKNSASRKSAVTMRGSTVRRTKIDESIIWCAGLPAGIEDLPWFFVFLGSGCEGIHGKEREAFSGTFWQSNQHLAAKTVLRTSILHLKTTLVFTSFFCLVGLSNAKSVQNTSIYATQEDTEICSVLSNMWAKYTANSGSFFHVLKSASTFRCFDPTFAPRCQKMQATCTTLICHGHHISYTHQLGDETSH